ncbi:hypothetical protein [Streptomyces sp. NPDC126499]|uniref:hypothetical protein n=1 Tax=Streptomyces sp. NPDC126499 TaxID=3155314 RepID=UPI00387EADE1
MHELAGVYQNRTRGIVALVFRCGPAGGAERTSDESTAVEWLTSAEVEERMAEVFTTLVQPLMDGEVSAQEGRTSWRT